MKLYSGPLSLFTAKVRIALAEKGLAHELVPVPWSPATAYEPKHPEVLARNPRAQVPVLVDGDVSLYDSTLILEYLEDAYPHPALRPATAAERARGRQLELEADEIFFPAVWTLIAERFYAPVQGRAGDASAVEAALERIAWVHRRLERQLGDGAWLLGRFGIPDIAHFLVAWYAANLGAPVPAECPATGAWFERVAARPAVAADLEAMRAALRGAGARPPAAGAEARP